MSTISLTSSYSCSLLAVPGLALPLLFENALIRIAKAFLMVLQGYKVYAMMILNLSSEIEMKYKIFYLHIS